MEVFSSFFWLLWPTHSFPLHLFCDSWGNALNSEAAFSWKREQNKATVYSKTLRPWIYSHLFAQWKPGWFINYWCLWRHICVCAWLDNTAIVKEQSSKSFHLGLKRPLWFLTRRSLAAGYFSQIQLKSSGRSDFCRWYHVGAMECSAFFILLSFLLVIQAFQES